MSRYLRSFTMKRCIAGPHKAVPIRNARARLGLGPQFIIVIRPKLRHARVNVALCQTSLTPTLRPSFSNKY